MVRPQVNFSQQIARPVLFSVARARDGGRGSGTVPGLPILAGTIFFPFVLQWSIGAITIRFDYGIVCFRTLIFVHFNIDRKFRQHTFKCDPACRLNGVKKPDDSCVPRKGTSCIGLAGFGVCALLRLRRRLFCVASSVA